MIIQQSEIQGGSETIFWWQKNYNKEFEYSNSCQDSGIIAWIHFSISDQRKLDKGSPLIARIFLKHSFTKIWIPLIRRCILSVALFLQYTFIYFYYIFMKSTIPLIALISHSTDFSCSQKTVLWEDLLYQQMKNYFK